MWRAAAATQAALAEFAVGSPGGRSGHPRWRGRAPGFPHALPTGTLPAGSLFSAASPNPEQRPEEEWVFRATVNRQPCSLRGKEGKRCHEGRSHRASGHVPATAAGLGGPRREQTPASLVLSLSLGSAAVPHPGRPQALRGNTSQQLDTARLARRKMTHGDTVYLEHRLRGTRCREEGQTVSCSPRTPAAQASRTSATLPRLPTAGNELRAEPKSPIVSFSEDGLGFFFFSGWMKEYTLPSPLFNYVSRTSSGLGFLEGKGRRACPWPIPRFWWWRQAWPFHKMTEGGPGRPVSGCPRTPISPPLQA